MKKYKLPKDSLVEPEETTPPRDTFIDNDVEAHGLPTTAPPGIGSQGPGHGGEATPTDEDDVEGHKRK